MVNEIFVSGPVVIEKGRILLVNDGKDPFYKIPGGKCLPGESLEQTAKREFYEETGLEVNLIAPLSTMNLSNNPKTNELQKISLYHWKAKLKSSISNYRSYIYNGHKIEWILLSNLQNFSLAPNLIFLERLGELK